AHYSLQSTWAFYTMEKFKWDAVHVGYSLAFVGLMMAIVQGGLSRILIPKIGPVNSIYFGMAMAIFGYFAYAFAPSGIFMYLIMVPFSLSGIAGPSIQGLVANQVPPNAQGELQGGLTSLMSVTAIFGPLLMTFLFNYFTKPNSYINFPGASFFMSFLLTSIALILVIPPLKKIKSNIKSALH
ncbi:MAG: tetracycline resistance MFS efflux pump, partial [Saprospiraceae bacterium]